jgi:hypothetical protein
MNTMEDKVRLALRETGEEISPRTVPPLRLQGARRFPVPRIPGRWGSWLTPLAAAAAVAAVVATSLAISGTFRGRQQGAGTGTVTARVHGAPIGPASALHLVPSYFVELTDPTQVQARKAVVRSTVSGHVLATITPPRPYNVFTWVSGAADDRTFVLAAQHWWNIAPGSAGARAERRDNTTPTVFFRLTFDPHTGAAQLTPLTVPGTIHSSGLAGMAVSPDATRVALDFRQSIEVVTLATGATRTWTWPGSGWIGNWKPIGQIFSWTADGKTLAFQQWGGHLDSTAYVRLLDTTAPGTSLTSAKVVLTFRNASGVLTFSDLNTLLTPDGTRIVTATNVYPRRPAGPTQAEITEYSVATGKPVLSEDEFAPAIGWQDVLWAGPRGRALVIADPRGKKTQGDILGVLSGNKFTPIPQGKDETGQIAW